MASILKVNTIQDATNSNTAMTIDSSGRVTRGVTPAWRLGLSADSNQTSSSAVEIPFDLTSGSNCFLSGGVTYSSSTYKITIPVAGIYMFGSTARVDGATAGNYLNMKIVKNGETTKQQQYYHLEDDVSNVYHSVSLSGIYNCSVSDTLKVVMTAQSDTNWHFDSASYFWGYLVG